MQVQGPITGAIVPQQKGSAEASVNTPKIPSAPIQGADAPPVKVEQPPVNVQEAEKARAEFLHKASQNYRAQTFFPISDTRFTIFKDDSGQYITRFTNLIDGRVTHIPEPELIRHYVKSRGGEAATVTTRA